MARGAVALTAAGAVAVLAVAPVVAVALRAGTWTLAAPDMAAVRFTVLQAALSAALSCALAVPLARALARRRFPGRGLFITALGAPFLLPVLVAVLGLLAVFGRAGWVNAGLSALGLPVVTVYGLHGVVLAHVFFNLPLAARLILFGWQAIPAERFRLARSLGLGPAEVMRHLEWPMLRGVLPGGFLAVFAVCLTSFAVALTLGGGPKATTVELAIYQALRFDFDLAAAARLSLVQLGLCAAAFAVASRLTVPPAFGAGLDRAPDIPRPGGWRRGADAAAMLAAGAFLALPLLAVVLRGLPGLADLPWQVWAAAGRSVTVALVAAVLTLACALPLALAAAAGARWAGLVATLPLALSSLVMGTGLFLMVQPLLRPADVALPVTMAVNAALALPFAYRLMLPGAEALRPHDRLAQSLGMPPLARLRLVTLPRLAGPMGFAGGLAAALAMGDLGVIALFATEGGETLPLMVHRLMGAYRMEMAASAALLLLVLSFALFATIDRIGRHAAS
ncbi:MAG: ABC transporter permease subunit [Paracoccaceae bacterium]|nr:MAG: ABC transporter permease subunit [Paracoccaceae bacterium]